MASKKTSRSAKPAAAKSTAGKKSEDVVMWLRLPRAMKVDELKKLGLPEAGCWGGDTCIAATSMHSEAGIVVTTGLEESIKKAGLSRRADPCFGGDTCIV
jgi:hypothetical protein